MFLEHMSAVGQRRSFDDAGFMSGFPSKAEIGGADKTRGGGQVGRFSPLPNKSAERHTFQTGSKIRIEPLSINETVSLSACTQ